MKHDSVKARIYIDLSGILYLSNPDTVITLSLNALEICKKNLANQKSNEKRAFLAIESSAYNNLGYIYENKGQLKLALEYYFEGLKIQETIGDKGGESQTYNNIGFLYTDLNNIPLAIEYIEKALLIREKAGDKKGISESLNNLGLIYRKYGDPNCKSQIKNVCFKAGLSKALDIYLKCLKIKEEVKDEYGIGIVLNNIGSVHNYLGNSDKALEYFNQSLGIREKLNDKKGISVSLNNIGLIYLTKKNFKLAELYCMKSLKIAKEIGFPDNIKRSAEGLSKIFKETKQDHKALEMYQLFISMRDSINNSAARKETEKLYFQMKFDKKMTTDSLRIEAKKKILSVELDHKKTQSYYLILGLILVIIFALFVFNRFKITQKQKEVIEKQKELVDIKNQIIEHKHLEITDSINYAERIQRSFLTTKELLDENLKDYFVFFKPKDIVSGDFYWASKLNNGNFVLVTADSTGHGVPGAIMSILNVTCLENAVKEGLVQPSEILNHTRKNIIERLKKDGSAEGGKDGMDASLISFDFKNNKFTYSAANNPVWIVRDTKIIELVPDKMPLGKHDKDTVSFTQHSFDLQKGDAIYALTDGMPDQFGGPLGKKYMYKRLKELLISISNLSMQEQKDTLQTAFNNWKGDLEQVDDITLIGIKVSRI